MTHEQNRGKGIWEILLQLQPVMAENLSAKLEGAVKEYGAEKARQVLIDEKVMPLYFIDGLKDVLAYLEYKLKTENGKAN